MGKRRSEILPLPENVTTSNITISFNHERVKLKMPILVYTNRHYLPLMHFVSRIGGKLFDEMGKLFINYKKEVYNFNASDLIRQVIFYDNDFYVTLFDICNILDLKTRWDYRENSISLYENRDVIPKPEVQKSEKIALVRLEDVTAGDQYDNPVNLEKLRIIGDMLYMRGVPFHISWIPRFVDPTKNIDNDLMESNSMNNANFLFTLDYLINRGGLLGLHGYTHQIKDQVSGEGYEFGEGCIEDVEEAKYRIEKAIDTANYLGLPYVYFESPHYSITEEQQNAIEDYFEYIYEPYEGVYNDVPIISPSNHKTKYIPAPLGYVKGENGVEEMLKKIDNLGEEDFASFFYHPTKEMEYIGLKRGKKGYPGYIYLDNSPLKVILNHLKDKGYVAVNIEDINI